MYYILYIIYIILFIYIYILYYLYIYYIYYLYLYIDILFKSVINTNSFTNFKTIITKCDKKLLKNVTEVTK